MNNFLPVSLKVTQTKTLMLKNFIGQLWNVQLFGFHSQSLFLNFVFYPWKKTEMNQVSFNHVFRCGMGFRNQSWEENPRS